MSDSGHHTGVCRCGNVALTLAVMPEFSVYCHCDDCRRATGAPVLASIGAPKEALEWTGTPARFVSGSATRLFCRDCGSPIAQEHDSRPDLTFINTAFMNDPEAFPPKAHTFEGEQLNWLALHDDLPRYEKTLLIDRP